MSISTKRADDDVGTAHDHDGMQQTPEQKQALGGGGEEGGRPEPKSHDDWARRGGKAGAAGRPPVAIGGNSAGQGDRMPAGGGTVTNEPATNPKTLPGNRHES